MVDIDINVEHPRVVPGVMIKPRSGEEVNSPSSPPQYKLGKYLESAPSHLKSHPTKFPPESLGLHPQLETGKERDKGD